MTWRLEPTFQTFFVQNKRNICLRTKRRTSWNFKKGLLHTPVSLALQSTGQRLGIRSQAFSRYSQFHRLLFYHGTGRRRHNWQSPIKLWPIQARSNSAVATGAAGISARPNPPLACCCLLALWFWAPALVRTHGGIRFLRPNRQLVAETASFPTWWKCFWLWENGHSWFEPSPGDHAKFFHDRALGGRQQWHCHSWKDYKLKLESRGTFPSRVPFHPFPSALFVSSTFTDAWLSDFVCGSELLVPWKKKNRKPILYLCWPSQFVWVKNGARGPLMFGCIVLKLFNASHGNRIPKSKPNMLCSLFLAHGTSGKLRLALLVGYWNVQPILLSNEGPTEFGKQFLAIVFLKFVHVTNPFFLVD